MLILLALLL